ncbi:DUF4232 domain-containing protein [Streptomyces sp. 8L]|uniref:DUF4232 domain-containing protein n=1 Tax=Streptomyces sp. 8L TaxID=2877242 RepID=UPI001CD5E803|nr:DUF4232 domain-containing protein [Streptomyces sp. 8L]MCA1218824.1 DUF4232 domain-containing protein [Streptomyces sp. 8L]
MTARLNKAVRCTAAVLAAVALGASATACGTSDSSPSTSAPSSSPLGDTSSAPAGTPSSDASGGTSASSGGTSSGNGASGSNASSTSSMCRTSNLRIAAKDQGKDAPGAAPGVGSVLITFTNTGGDCRVAGFPGVDLKTNYGTESVDRDKQEAGVPFTLRAGKTATANVVYPLNNTGGSGVRVSALVITPPNETHPVTAPVDFSLPVSDKDTGRLEVTPVFKPVSQDH